MPGVVSTLAVHAGQEVKAGDVLLSIEAMKMETALHAERDGKIAEVLVHAGSQIDAKDLLGGVRGVDGYIGSSRLRVARRSPSESAIHVERRGPPSCWAAQRAAAAGRR